MNFINTHAIERAYARFAFLHVESGSRRRLWLKIAKMHHNGVPILQAIEDLRDRRIEADGVSSPQAIALAEWASAIQNGVRLCEAIVGWVSDAEMMLIAAGEQSGALEGALESAARLMEAKRQIIGTIFRGSAYPFVLFMMSFAVLYLFGFKIIPAFTTIVHNDGWHGLARAMITASNFARQWLWLVALSFVVTSVGFVVSLPILDGAIRIKLDRYAPYSIYRVMLGSTWLISLAALVNAGLRIESALEQLAGTAVPWLQNRVNACLSAVRSGLNLGEALARTGYEFPDKEIIDDLGTYAGLSGLNEALVMLGNEWLNESVEQIKQRMTVVFGVSILTLGIVVSVMVAGMFDMQVQLSQIIGQSMR